LVCIWSARQHETGRFDARQCKVKTVGVYGLSADWPSMPEAPYRTENPEVASSGAVALDAGRCDSSGGASSRSRISQSSELASQGLRPATIPRPDDDEKHRKLVRIDESGRAHRAKRFAVIAQVDGGREKVLGNLHRRRSLVRPR